MTLRIGEIARWHEFEKASVLKLPAWAGATQPRLIRINVNSPDLCRFWLVGHDGEIKRFLARTVGLETIEFSEVGDVFITHDGDDVLIQTSEREPTFAQSVGETYTRMWERAARNPELEAVAFQMMRNVEARMKSFAEEAERREQRAYEAGKSEAKPAHPAAQQPVAPQPGSDNNGSASGAADPKAGTGGAPSGTPAAGSGSGDNSGSDGGTGGQAVAAKPKA